MYTDNHAKHINTNADLQTVKASGTYNYHSALNSQTNMSERLLEKANVLMTSEFEIVLFTQCDSYGAIGF
jgi:hypothetical protein